MLSRKPPVTAADVRPRWVELTGTDNVRDLGGLAIPGAGGTRFGLVYRASTLQELTARDQARLLDELGVRTIIDLRSPDEVRREGYGELAKAPVTRVNLPVRKATPRPGEAVPDSRRVDLVRLYYDMLAGSPESVVSAARIVANAEQHAVVFHCAGGKDRTGILAAILLDAVGVPAETIIEDYALTAQRLDRIRERLLRLPSYRDLPSVREGVLTAEPDVMRQFLANLRAESGGAAEWLLRHGFTEADLTRLRETLVSQV
ncbi:MAG: protein-tyrosine-phosphatase [Actinophytocola sp.]|nr:protein-tyrosine-phosphatase [Actinophytocola sp.]